MEHDAGVEPVTQAEVARVFADGVAALHDILRDVVARMPAGPPASVAGVLDAARFGPPETAAAVPG